MSETLHPPGWAAPKGYANGIAAKGRFVFTAGQIGWNPETCQIETDDFVEQVAQTLRNVAAVLQAAGAEPRHLVRLTWYVTDKAAYLRKSEGDRPRLPGGDGEGLPGHGRGGRGRPAGRPGEGRDRGDGGGGGGT